MNLYHFHHSLSLLCFVLTTITSIQSLLFLLNIATTPLEIQSPNPPSILRNATRNIFLKCKGSASVCFNAFRQRPKSYRGLKWSFLVRFLSVVDLVMLVILMILESFSSCLCAFEYLSVPLSLELLLSLLNIPKTPFLFPHYWEFNYVLLENLSFELLTYLCDCTQIPYCNNLFMCVPPQQAKSFMWKEAMFIFQL